MTEKEWLTYTAAIAQHGPKKQAEKLLEEMAELQVEICHIWDRRGDVAGLITEIADVTILLEQMTFYFDIEKEVQAEKARKLERLDAMLKREREEAHP